MAATDTMVFYGASGHGKVIIEAWRLSGGTVTGIVDDNHEVKALAGFPVSHGNVNEVFAGVPLIISIGDNAIRKKIVGRTSSVFGRVFHPSAIISGSSTVGEGTVCMAGSILNAGATVGNHVILNTGAVVDHDCRIDHFVHVSPNATLCGGVHVGEGTHIGAAVTVIPGIRIGKWATIGAGTVVIEDVPAFALVVGVPGKVKEIRKRS